MKNFPLFVMCLVTLIACSGDDTEPFNDVNTNLQATVLHDISCMNTNNERIYELKIENHSSITTFAAPNLPDEFKQNGMQITFDLGKKNTSLSHCVALYGPEYFYDVLNVKPAQSRQNE